MASETEVYIAGVGFPTLSLAGTSVKTIVASLVSAATKALLDASVTFDDVTQTVVTLSGNTPNYGSEVSGAFCHRDIAMDEVEKGYEFDTSFTLIRDRSAQCGMLNTVKKSAAVAFILVCDAFLQSHTYLKDSAVLVRKPHTRRVDAKGRTVDRLYDICQIVWALRGWSRPHDTDKREACLSYCGVGSSKMVELSRADARAVPNWKDVELKQEGKHRLGYNPATGYREISQEDFETVRASGKAYNTGTNSIRFRRKGGNRAALSKLLDHHAEARPDSTAVISHVQGCTISFRQLQDRSVNLAKAMARAGIRKSSLVGIISGTRYDYLEIFFACARLGAALILFNYAYTDSEMLALLEAIKPQILFSPPEAKAFDYVLGFTCSNDVSARTFQSITTQWSFSKGLDGSCPLGRVLVTKDAIPDPQALDIKAIYNGVTVQDGNTKDMIFNIAKQISYLSQGTTIEAGTIFLTGTPAGIGFIRNSRVVLEDGDDIRVWIEKIGTLVNKVRYEEW